MIKVLSVFGTRPEAIKMCPLVLELEKHSQIKSLVCLTGQHREMLDQVIDIFGVKPDYDLNIMRPKQTLTTITTSVLEKMEGVLDECKPDLVLVHGDTSTSFVVALAAFYKQIPVGHVEAGLRTYDKYSPFPEEMNRCLTGRIAELHFAPTENNKKNLEMEKITNNIFVTGNTVIDAFKTTVKENYQFHNEELKKINFEGKKCVLVTAHRRENLGVPLENICHAIKKIAQQYIDAIIIYPVHLNPLVRETVFSILDNVDNIKLIDPIDVEDMHNIMSRSFLVMTDSGGLQEEAPSCGVPVLVLRTETERPEAVEAGTVKVVGVKEEDIFYNAQLLFENEDKYNEMTKSTNPYGDGHASERIADKIIGWRKSRERAD
ncbi:UDP-N-acetylglucosamine 2-epimerase (non-hydrolysing) [Anaerosporobacter mobilis DSM 15930]|uniref:UDP-N-acetylglucosamine 2-epimerase (non-hydrolyzing) n=1 Tax=Anaerosporobacter mobilis DSM 15930 TaxID=1120996 RepID=A0A1M7LCN1_9FIRM|nr:UDP-N-acetylglucosamine 2-epimerase (non-hydrolyzing) [Anaerosporobacter mobilis]SHM75909.1 UDP-N-acetylglucosamine 2-epimerase (non-hydrolysing) [Anaerosporobacter mobilis DSM 15930]